MPLSNSGILHGPTDKHISSLFLFLSLLAKAGYIRAQQNKG